MKCRCFRVPWYLSCLIHDFANLLGSTQCGIVTNCTRHSFLWRVSSSAPKWRLVIKTIVLPFMAATLGVPSVPTLGRAKACLRDSSTHRLQFRGAQSRPSTVSICVVLVVVDGFALQNGGPRCSELRCPCVHLSEFHSIKKCCGETVCSAPLRLQGHLPASG